MNETSGIARQIGLIDRAAIALSGLCLVHCVATALILALLASAGGLLANPLFHEVGLGIAILLGLYAFTRGFLTHRRKVPVMIGGAGLASMGYALSLHHGVSGEVLFTIIGVTLVAIAHEMNRRSILAAERGPA